VLDLSRCDPTLLRLVDVVVTELLAKSALLDFDHMMIVGARCRDILQSALGHEFSLRVTSDIDLGLAVSNWAAYDELVDMLPAAGNTGIRFRVANTSADLMPFGAVEDPPGTVTPASRREPISVWGFAEVFEAALPLALPSTGTIRIPTVAGYASLKLVAWLDRSVNGEYKDASDIATVIYWYSRSPEVATYAYETSHGQDLLVQEALDDTMVAARVLGEHIAAVIGHERLSEIAKRWSASPRDLLYYYMTVPNAPDWISSQDRRRALIQAMERGMGIDPAA
jgi:predicted nucleotidyltransferase